MYLPLESWCLLRPKLIWTHRSGDRLTQIARETDRDGRRSQAGVHQGRVRRSPWPAGRRRSHRAVESLLLPRRVRGVRADGVLRGGVEPGGVPDDGAEGGDGVVGAEREQLDGHRLADPHRRRLHRRRLPRPLLDLHLLLPPLPHGNDSDNVVRLPEGAAPAVHPGRHLRDGDAAAGDLLLRGAVHHGHRRRWHQAQHLHVRRRPVRRLRRAGEPHQGLLLQLVDVQLLHRRPRRRSRPRLRPGERRVGCRLHHSHRRPRAVAVAVLRRHAVLPAQACPPGRRRRPGEARREGVQGGVREPEAEATGTWRRRRRAARARRGVVRRRRDEAAAAPHAGVQVPGQGGAGPYFAGGGGGGGGAVHGDGGGGGEAHHRDDRGVADDAGAVHHLGAGEHPVREAGHHPGPQRRRRPHPGGLPRQLHHHIHAPLHPGLRPRACPPRPPPHRRPARHHAPAAARRRVRAPGGGGGVRLPRGAPPHARGPRRLRHRRTRHRTDEHLLDAAAVHPHRRRRRVQLRRHPRVLLRAVAAGDAEPRHHILHQRPRRRQLPQQPARHRRRPGHQRPRRRRQELDRRQPQRLAPRLLLRLPAAARGDQPGGVRVGGDEVRVQEGVLVGRRGRRWDGVAGGGDGRRRRQGEGGGEEQGDRRAIDGGRRGTGRRACRIINLRLIRRRRSNFAIDHQYIYVRSTCKSIRIMGCTWAEIRVGLIIFNGLNLYLSKMRMGGSRKVN